MASGGYRANAGRPKGAKSRLAGNAPVAPSPADVKRAARKAGLSPLDYMLNVMNDAEADDARRDRMAIAAAPFVHSKPAESQDGKKAQRQANAEKSASDGLYAAPNGPKLVVSNK